LGGGLEAVMTWVRGLLEALRSGLPILGPLLVSALVFDPLGAVGLRALVVAGLSVAIMTVAQAAMARARPASVEVRRTRAFGAEGQPLIDTLGLMAFLAYVVGWLAFLPWDASRLHVLPAPPAWALWIGLLAAAFGSAFTQRAIWDNAFAAPAVRTQAGQTVISTGAYGLVRHPLYAGNLLYFAGVALWIGSLAGVAGVGVILAFTIARIVVEERHLRDGLPGYADYVKVVRARLIPFLI
jgi:protein-S-isoprenylcysteine O-methyltransferase Ste14